MLMYSRLFRDVDAVAATRTVSCKGSRSCKDTEEESTRDGGWKGVSVDGETDP